MVSTHHPVYLQRPPPPQVILFVSVTFNNSSSQSFGNRVTPTTGTPTFQARQFHRELETRGLHTTSCYCSYISWTSYRIMRGYILYEPKPHKVTATSCWWAKICAAERGDQGIWIVSGKRGLQTPGLDMYIQKNQSFISDWLRQTWPQPPPPGMAGPRSWPPRARTRS